jgi:hypothetical protein
LNLAVFHTVNSGLFFWDGQQGLLVDGLHSDDADGFSPMPAALCQQLRERSGLFAHLDGLAFTHLHDDHFDPERVRQLMAAPGAPVLYAPGLPLNTAKVRPLEKGAWLAQLPGAELIAADTIHDGAPFREEIHQSFVLRMGGDTVFLAGDADFREEDAPRFLRLAGAPITAGFFNLFQICRPHLRRFIRALAPQRLFLEHLPFYEDDRYGLRANAQRHLKHMPEDLPVEVLRHMAWLDGRRNNFQEMEIEYDLSGIGPN